MRNNKNSWSTQSHVSAFEEDFRKGTQIMQSSCIFQKPQTFSFGKTLKQITKDKLFVKKNTDYSQKTT